MLVKIPLGLDKKYSEKLISRGLRLNCVHNIYSDLWSDTWGEFVNIDNWSKNDERLSSFNNLTNKWNKNSPLVNWYERRLSLIEIDVITSMGLGLSLSDLILIYNLQFPVLQQNENDTWYDQKGNIVFTCSKGLNGVGLDRSVWNTIRNMREGETYEHTIEKSELYHGERVTYYAPFEKCDRVEDYKVAWAHFEKIFNQN